MTYDDHVNHKVTVGDMVVRSCETLVSFEEASEWIGVIVDCVIVNKGFMNWCDLNYLVAWNDGTIENLGFEQINPYYLVS